jgi:hypothetical protein
LPASIIGAAIEVHRILRPGLNFHTPLLREGIKRVVLGLEELPISTNSQT